MSIETMAALLLIASVVAMLARRFRLPYTVGLLAAGIVIALTHLNKDITLTKKLKHKFLFK